MTSTIDDGDTQRAELLALEKKLKEIGRRKLERALELYMPYPKQKLFHGLGATMRERLLMAANRAGKTFCGAAEMAYHLTGLYPEWWTGRRFDRPVKAWAASDTGLTTRDVVQTKLCGPYGVVEMQGTGAIPRNCVNWNKDVSLARGVADAYDTVQVQHHTNGKKDGKSILTFKSFEQGRKKWQGDAVDVIWCDEEPDMEIYSEALARIAPTNAESSGGIIYVTFTPLQGMSKVVYRFVNEKSPDRSVTGMTLDDAQHINPVERKKIIDGYPEYEREARSKGTPMLGSGRIFRTAESAITVQPFTIPAHWSLLWGTDFGIDHPFAAVLLAWDKDTDTVYVIHTVRMKDATPLQHAAAMKPVMHGFGGSIPAAWPQDGWQRKEFEGKLEPLAKIYKSHGLKMMDQHAKFPDGSNSTEVGILQMDERMKSNRWKVFASCEDWFEEYRLYHRKDGQIVRLHDDLMSASRVGLMTVRSAKVVLFDPNLPGNGRETKVARDIDISPFGD